VLSWNSDIHLIILFIPRCFDLEVSYAFTTTVITDKYIIFSLNLVPHFCLNCNMLQ
jgi:hypothetical protein